MFAGLQPLLSRLPVPNSYVSNRTFTLAAFQKHEHDLQVSRPSLRYNELLPLAYKAFAQTLGLPVPFEEEASSFGAQIGSWPAFPDTVPALKKLKKHYKLLILSNIDNASIDRTISGPLHGVEFDAVYTAQNIGSYKPDLKNFHYLLEGAKKELGVDKSEVLHTAQSLPCDIVPAKTMEISSTWIDREDQEEIMLQLKADGKVDFTWRFGSMGEMAEAVESAFKEVE
jgi:2-haloalkanoic acid dehalogenase type II